jgi:hypothetical protein
MAARAVVAGRITDWPSVWLSESGGSATALSLQNSTLLTCIDSSSGKIVSYCRLAGLQALKGNFRRSQQALDLGKRGAKGIRTPGLLHAMQQEQRSGQGLDSSDLDLPCTGVPVSACKSVRVGCLLGCPLASDRILPAPPARMAQQFQTPIKRGQRTAPDPRPGQLPISIRPTVIASQQRQQSPFRSCQCE